VRATAEAIAATPTELLGLLKLAINKTQEVQGFREAMFFGCEVDAIAHKSDSVLKVNQLIRERGLREALETWRQIV
jgi:enoyl-CoA hydratase